MSELVELLAAMVRIPSVNPDGDPGTDRVGEGELAVFVADFLRETGAEVDVDYVLPGRPNVLGRFPTDVSWKPKLLFAPHLDTVSVKGMVIDPFGGNIRNGRLWGRGACDTKGSMAAMLWALRQEREWLKTLSHEIHFAAFMAEETGQYGSKDFAQRRRDYDFAVVGEPTGCRVVHAHKGCVWVELETQGVAVHGSKPELGVNAILLMSEILGELRQGFSAELARQGRSAVLGVPTWNAGMIRGGCRANIVAESCRVTLDIRTTPELEANGGAVECLTDFLRVRTGGEVSVKVLNFSSPLSTPTTHPMAVTLAELGSGFDTAPWFCDAAVLSEVGIPAVAMGPGEIDQAHTSDEWIDLGELERCGGIFRKFLRSLTAR